MPIHKSHIILGLCPLPCPGGGAIRSLIFGSYFSSLYCSPQETQLDVPYQLWIGITWRTKNIICSKGQMLQLRVENAFLSLSMKIWDYWVNARVVYTIKLSAVLFSYSVLKKTFSTQLEHLTLWRQWILKQQQQWSIAVKKANFGSPHLHASQF